MMNDGSDWAFILLLIAFSKPSAFAKENQNGGTETCDSNCKCKETNTTTVEDLRNDLLAKLKETDLSREDLALIRDRAETLKVISEIQTESLYEAMKDTKQRCCCPPTLVSIENPTTEPLPAIEE